ncbi:MAG: ribosome biogenesis GTPase Der [Deltaproteobacteria bacterium]|nr:ribosome biogenesis GTPase Der [Deltaproteobacteria bacterium]
MSSIIAIVGRPNVGKSTLFNRLSKSRGALVDDEPGITRDLLYAFIHWDDIPLALIDTGGFDDSDRDPLLKQVAKQVETAVAEADRIIFMVDGREGLMPGDKTVADLLRRSEKPVFIAANKIDGPEHEHLIHEFYTLGWKEVFPLSAEHGFGLKSLMDKVISDLAKQDIGMEDDTVRIRVAVLGRPNAGKSSLINRILGFERLLVSEIPGTTRDSVDTLFNWRGKEYMLIDTAGIRRKARVKEKIEKFSMIKALRSLDRCHVAVVLLDAEAGIAEQDARICGYAFERGRAIVLGVNKWDLVQKDPEKIKHLKNAIQRQLNFISFAPRINLSALTGERVKKLFEVINLVYGEFDRKISTAEVNKALEEMTQKKPPAGIGSGRLKFFYGTQTRVRPPTFEFFANRPDKIHFSYKRFMLNQLREHFELNHIPIRLKFRKK